MGQITMFNTVRSKCDGSSSTYTLFNQNIILRAFLQAEDKESKKRQQKKDKTIKAEGTQRRQQEWHGSPHWH